MDAGGYDGSHTRRRYLPAMSRSRWPLIVLFIGIALLCARLGLWQVDRLRQRQRANAAVLAARGLPPVDLNAEGRVTGLAPGRPVRAVGRYDHAREVVIMGRVLEGTPGVQVLTPLRLAGSDRAVLVNRGFVPAPDGFSAELDSLAEPGLVTIQGTSEAFAATADRNPPRVRNGRLAVGRVNYRALADEVPYPLLGVIVRQAPAAGLPALPRRLPPDPLDDGPHLGYAIQWFGFATIALVFAVVFWRRGAGTPLAERSGAGAPV
jgi:surfeit locus 1 family protein